MMILGSLMMLLLVGVPLVGIVMLIGWLAKREKKND